MVPSKSASQIASWSSLERNGGLALPMPTPPDARMRNWLAFVDGKSASVASAQTKAPVWMALARRPAARLSSPPARLFRPPARSGPRYQC